MDTSILITLLFDMNETSEKKSTIELEEFSGVVWRIMFADQSEQACEPVRSPIGRFHHDKQIALYTSCTKEGASVAIQRYLESGDPERVIVPLQINATRIYDIRKTDFSKSASIVWQGNVENGESAPTWQYSDAARAAGAQGMLYSSRSRPDLTHLVLFDVSNGIVTQAGDPEPWRTDSALP